MSEPTVFLVDDDTAVIKAFSRLLRSTGLRVEAFECAESFLCHFDGSRPGCVLLDLAMPGFSGIAVQQALCEAGHSPPIVFVSAHADIPASVKAMKLGAVDFLTKPVAEADLFAAIHSALRRDVEDRRARAESASIRNRIDSLTPRERDVLKGVVAGKLNKQIAAELNTAEKTVKIQRAKVMAKMEAGSVAELARLIERLGVACPADIH